MLEHNLGIPKWIAGKQNITHRKKNTPPYTSIEELKNWPHMKTVNNVNRINTWTEGDFFVVVRRSQASAAPHASYFFFTLQPNNYISFRFPQHPSIINYIIIDAVEERNKIGPCMLSVHYLYNSLFGNI